LEIKEEELMPLAIGDINPNNEVLPTLRRINRKEYIPSWGTPTQLPTTTTYAPQTKVLPKNTNLSKQPSIV
jgi:hypothetical protein